MDTRKHRVDDLFRDGLSDLEISPTASGQSQFMNKAKQELRKRQARTLLPGLLIILGIGLLCGGYFFIKNGTNDNDIKTTVKTKVAKNRSENNKPQQVNNSNSKSIQPQTQVTSSQHGLLAATKLHVVQKANYPTKVLPRINKTKKTQEFSSSVSIKPSAALLKDTGQGLLNNTKNPTENQSFSLNEKAKLDTSSIVIRDQQQLPLIKDTTTNPESPPVTKVRKPSSKSSFNDKTWNIRAGIYYMPEWIFNSLDRDKYVNNFGAEGIFRFGPFSIRTGIGLSITKAYNELVIETKPYLGSYQAVDSMTFHWDSRHYYLIKTVYASRRDVFDTALHYNYYTREMQYTYLQVPLIMGYDFLTTRWVTLGVRVGAVMSVLLQSKVLTTAFEAGKDKVVLINDISPERIHLNWQAMTGINASLGSTHRFILEIEPNLRYYFDSVNEKLGPADKPWSFGLQTSFLINF